MSPDHIRLPFVAIAGPDELPVDDVAARSPNPPKFAADHAPPFDSTRTVPVFHKRITFLIGPKVSEHFFKARDTEMSQKEVYEFNVPTFGKGVVFDVDHITRAEQFRFFANSLKSDRLRQYVGMMVKAVSYTHLRAHET